MKKRAALTGVLLWAGVCTLGVADSGGADVQISGLKPYQRPEGAPSIVQITHDSEWYTRALTGVSKPYPESLRFLDNQGNWYTPFDRPGMSAPYDIRGWQAQ